MEVIPVFHRLFSHKKPAIKIRCRLITDHKKTGFPKVEINHRREACVYFLQYLCHILQHLEKLCKSIVIP